MKKSKKILYWFFVGISLVYILILIFPHSLFGNKIEYKNFTIYYHSNELSTEKLKLILDESEKLLKKTELFKTEINQDIYMCSSYNEFTFFAVLSRKTFAINYISLKSKENMCLA